MKFLTVIRKLIPKDVPTPLGRWKLENCTNIINNKIDLSNEDHCGPCGQYALEKIGVKKEKNLNNSLEKIDTIIN